MPNYIDEYLVKLGFSTDVAGYDKFQKSLADASSVVTSNTSGMVRKIAEFETAAIAGFAAVSAAVIHMADKAAMADQSYRLFALHMFTSVPVARQLKIGIDAIGASLEDIMNDPELQRRFDMFVKLQQRIALPEDFEKNMEKVRDLRQSFINLYEFIDKYLIPMITNSLVRIFGKDMDQMLAKVQEWTNYLITHMPEIADFFAETLTPILEVAKGLFKELWEAALEFMHIFTRVIGMLTKDEELNKAETNWRDFAKALSEAALAIGGIATDIMKLFVNVMKLVEALMALDTVLSPGASYDERKKALKEAWGKIQSMEAFGGTTPPPPRAPGETKEEKTQREAVLASMGAGGAGPTPAGFFAGAGVPDTKAVQQMIAAQAVKMGIDPKLALAVAQQESGFQQFTGGGVTTSPTGAQGVMQVLPSTAKLMNKKLGRNLDPTDVAQNIELGLSVLQERLQATHGNVEMALRQYNQGTARSAYMGDEAGRYARQVMAREGGINIDTININVPGGDPDKVRPAVLDALNQAQKMRQQRQLAEFANPQWHTSTAGAG